MTINEMQDFLHEEGYALMRYRNVNCDKREFFINRDCSILHVKSIKDGIATCTIWTYDKTRGKKSGTDYHLCYVGFSAQLHRVMAWTFLGEPEQWQTDVDHIDGDKSNNDPSNLRWCTRSENMKYYYANKQKKAI